jgi:hypothetical protein
LDGEPNLIDRAPRAERDRLRRRLGGEFLNRVAKRTDGESQPSGGECACDDDGGGQDNCWDRAEDAGQNKASEDHETRGRGGHRQCHRPHQQGRGAAEHTALRGERRRARIQ